MMKRIAGHSRPETLAIAAIAFGIAFTATATAQDLKAANRFAGAKLGFDLQGDYTNVTLTVTGPEGFATTAFSEKAAPVLDLAKAGRLPDGEYRYQLSAADTKTMVRQMPLDNGREGKAPDQMPASVAMSGVFSVKGGKVVEPVEEKE